MYKSISQTLPGPRALLIVGLIVTLWAHAVHIPLPDNFAERWKMTAAENVLRFTYLKPVRTIFDLSCSCMRLIHLVDANTQSLRSDVLSAVHALYSRPVRTPPQRLVDARRLLRYQQLSDRWCARTRIVQLTALFSRIFFRCTSATLPAEGRTPE